MKQLRKSSPTRSKLSIKGFQRWGWSILLISTMILGASYSIAQQSATTEFILGIAIPNKTTLTEFEEAVKAKRCKYEAKLNDFFLPPTVKVEPGCFDLLGNPTIEAIAQSPNTPITNIAIRFPADSGKAMYRQYMARLQEIYGKPNQEVIRGDVETAIWEPPEVDMVVTLVNAESANEHFIAFVMGDSAKEARKFYKLNGLR